MEKLEVGCGTQKRPGYLGMDVVKLAGVDVVHDMNIAPWPFPDNTFTEAVFDDVLEHSKDLLTILSEVYRVCQNDAVIKVSVPHFTCDNMYTDPTHTTFFSSRSFDYFDKSVNHKHGFYLEGVDFKVRRVYLCFREYFLHNDEPPRFNPFRLIGLEYLINRYRRVYEKYFCWIMPITEVYFELQVKK
ncbi:MAG TPA: methyltransferase domain-containing protein [Bacteroidota bacterium]|nr:methyltransferase domain-containing protein [Bacteroidota bacterium]